MTRGPASRASLVSVFGEDAIYHLDYFGTPVYCTSDDSAKKVKDVHRQAVAILEEFGLSLSDPLQEAELLAIITGLEIRRNVL